MKIYVLANWEDSRDAKIEHVHAKKGERKSCTKKMYRPIIQILRR